MSATDPVQAVAEVLRKSRLTWGTHSDRWGDVGWQRDFWGEVAEVAVTAAEPHMSDWTARDDMRHAYETRLTHVEAERDALAARLAAVEAALTHAEQLPDAGNLYHDVTYRDGVEHTATRLRAALATGTTTNQQEADQ